MDAKELKAMLESKANDIIKRKAPFTGEAMVNEGMETIHKSATKDERIVSFQKAADDLYLASAVLGKKPQELKLYKSFKGLLENENMSELKKAMTTGGSTAGAEWIPTGYSAQLMQMIENERVLAKFFPSFQMPQSPYVWPITTGRPTAYKATEGSAVTETTDPTSNVTFTAAKLMAYISASFELEEDSIVAILPELKQALALGLADGEENVILNGCADNSIDSDNTTAGDQRRVAVGLRKLAIANSYTTDLGTFNSDTLGALRKKLGKFFDPTKCGWVVSVSGYEQLTRLKDASGNPVCLTVQNAGAAATFMTGVIDKAFGMPVILSGKSRDDLNASGVFDNTTKTKTSIQLVRFDAFKLGYKGGIYQGTQKQEKTQTTDLVASMRMAFMPMFPIASNATVWNAYNITA